MASDMPRHEVPRMTTIKADDMVFDAYGTLYDIQSVAAASPRKRFPAMAKSSRKSGGSSSSNTPGCVR
jgi:hypothetical protein